VTFGNISREKLLCPTALQQTIYERCFSLNSVVQVYQYRHRPSRTESTAFLTVLQINSGKISHRENSGRVFVIKSLNWVFAQGAKLGAYIEPCVFYGVGISDNFRLC